MLKERDLNTNYLFPEELFLIIIFHTYDDETGPCTLYSILDIG